MIPPIRPLPCRARARVTSFLPPLLALLAFGAMSSFGSAAGAQDLPPASCSSDGQPQPTAVVERFISADCQACWQAQPARKAAPGELAIDWIVPGSRGADAPLSAAESADALLRLQSLGLPPPAQHDAVRTSRVPPAGRLRVAHGTAVNDYIGASIELRPAGRGHWRAWLLLVEAIDAGTEGTPVPRLLVRAAFQPPWPLDRPPTQAQQQRLFDSRPLRIPPGARPDHLQVVGWAQDARGRIRAIARSSCGPIRRQQGR